jgi:transaldolase / glucose-6-phosphate isomerase
MMAYLDESPQIDQALQQLRLSIRSLTNLATTSGYGPRFLHSTGQYHKGGPNKGLFLQLTADVVHDLPVPEKSYSFGNFLKAQARGDLMVLRKHGRRVVRIHLKDDAERGLKELRLAIEKAVRATTA